MEKLISMVDFVSENKRFNIYEANSICNRIVRYANFLSQKLELWMFVPCKLVEGIWVVLEEPIFTTDSAITELSKVKEYQEAKDRVLFEGFRWINVKNVSNDDIDIYFDSDGIKAYNGFKKTDLCSIEKLIEFKLELTPTVQKQIY